jgi:hypothetical protein
MGKTRDGRASSLAVIEIADSEYATVYDVPFISMNRAGTEYEGEVILSGVAETDDARFRELLDVGLIHGQRVDSMEQGPYGSVLVYFTADAVGVA